MSLVWLARTNRTTLARDNPCFFATMVNDIPERRSRTSATWSTSSGVRPIRRPSSFARRIPARTRSTINDRSSSAMALIITMIALPSGPSVSIASRCERNWIPNSLRSSSTWRKCLVLRARRSQDQTRTASNLWRWASLRSRSRAGRLARLARERAGDEARPACRSAAGGDRAQWRVLRLDRGLPHRPTTHHIASWQHPERRPGQPRHRGARDIR
jgi:hypothetical protein